jgi:cytochrome P450
MPLHADFASQDYFRNPAAAIEKLRAIGPVVEVRFPIIGKVWATTTQALADQVLKDTATFTIRKDDGDVAGLRWWMPGIVRTLAKSMLSMDEPDHKRLRDIVDEAFRRRVVLDMEPHIQALGARGPASRRSTGCRSWRPSERRTDPGASAGSRGAARQLWRERPFFRVCNGCRHATIVTKPQQSAKI